MTTAGSTTTSANASASARITATTATATITIVATIAIATVTTTTTIVGTIVIATVATATMTGMTMTATADAQGQRSRSGSRQQEGLRQQEQERQGARRQRQEIDPRQRRRASGGPASIVPARAQSALDCSRRQAIIDASCMGNLGTVPPQAVAVTRAVVLRRHDGRRGRTPGAGCRTCRRGVPGSSWTIIAIRAPRRCSGPACSRQQRSGRSSTTS